MTVKTAVTVTIKVTIIACETNRTAQLIKIKPTRTIITVRYLVTMASFLIFEIVAAVMKGFKNKSVINIAVMLLIPIKVIVDNKY